MGEAYLLPCNPLGEYISFLLFPLVDIFDFCETGETVIFVDSDAVNG